MLINQLLRSSKTFDMSIQKEVSRQESCWLRHLDSTLPEWISKTQIQEDLKGSGSKGTCCWIGVINPVNALLIKMVLFEIPNMILLMKQALNIK